MKRIVLGAALLVLMLAPFTCGDGPKRIQWDDAKNHVGEHVTVVGPVVSYHETKTGGHVTLNIGKDYPSTDRFTVFIRDKKAAWVPSDYYVGKTIAVTGTVKLYAGVPEIGVTEESQIVVEK